MKIGNSENYVCGITSYRVKKDVCLQVLKRAFGNLLTVTQKIVRNIKKEYIKKVIGIVCKNPTQLE